MGITIKSNLRKLLHTMISKFKQKPKEKEIIFQEKQECLCVYRFRNNVHQMYKEVMRDSRQKVPLPVTSTGATDRVVAEVIVRELKMPISPPEFEAQLTDLTRKTLLGAPIKKGAERLLTHLYDNKIPMALATNSTEQAVRLQSAARPKLFGMFHHKVSITDPEVFRGKPYPDVYLIAAARFPDKPKPSKCLVFEDSPTGVKAAVEAGMQVIMTPERRLDREHTRQATLVIPSLLDFKPELFGLPPFDDPPTKPITKGAKTISRLEGEVLGDSKDKKKKTKGGPELEIIV